MGSADTRQSCIAVIKPSEPGIPPTMPPSRDVPSQGSLKAGDLKTEQGQVAWKSTSTADLGWERRPRARAGAGLTQCAYLSYSTILLPRLQRKLP